MVVATFVLCIALGSFAVSALRRVRTSYLVATQWLLVVLLLGLYWAADDAPYWAHALRVSFSSGASDFYPFQIAVFVAILAIFCVPLGLSGALLPLIFHRLRRASADLGRTAGGIYSWNTLGSLLGALVGGHLLLFWFEIDDTYRMAVFALAGAAAITTGTVMRRARIASLIAVAVIGAVLAGQPSWDPRKLSAGLFRYRTPRPELAGGPDALVPSLKSRRPDDYIRFYDDDPSTSVAVFDITQPGAARHLAIINNGKSDGSIPGDDMTTGLLALLPALFAERRERAFVIGYGTGKSVGELAALEDVQEVVVAEISRGVVRAAPLFEQINRHALASPKTQLVRSDAYRTLMRGQTGYDVIVSEPSNPWVTGVEMLYSLEFLEAARSRLAPGGVYAQWFHIYETDDRSVALVLNTFRRVFPQVSVWLGRPGDLILLGFEDAERKVDLEKLESLWQRADFNRQLKSLPLASFPRLLAHEILPPGVLGETPLPDRVHTILHPILSYDAARAFFGGGVGRLPGNPTRAVATVGARNSLVGHFRASRGGTLPAEDRLELLRETCDLRLALCATLFAQWVYDEPGSETLATSLQRARTDPTLQATLQPGIVQGLSLLFRDEAQADAPNSFEFATDLTAAFLKYYHHAAPFNAEALHESWRRCAREDSRCARQLESALAMGKSSSRLSQR
jgi:spermidine synthase